MVQAIRNIDAAMGTGRKEPSKSEQKNMAAARKSIVAKCAIRKGERFSEQNLTTKRPGNGISPMEWPNLMGKESPKDFEPDDLILL